MEVQLTQENYVSWLQKTVAEIINKQPNSIDISTPLASYGLDSVHAIQLSGELEEWLDIELEPTIAWDYPSINEMASFLYKKMSVGI